MRYYGKCPKCGKPDVLSSTANWGRIRCRSCKQEWSGVNDAEMHSLVYITRELLPIATTCTNSEMYISDECPVDPSRMKIINWFLGMTAAKRHGLSYGYEGRSRALIGPKPTDLLLVFQESRVHLWDRSGIDRGGTRASRRIVRWCHEMLRLAVLAKLPKSGYAAMARTDVPMAELPEVMSEVLQAAAHRAFTFQKSTGLLWNPIRHQEEFIWSIIGHMAMEVDLKENAPRH